jgi:hypothetical protein
MKRRNSAVVSATLRRRRNFFNMTSLVINSKINLVIVLPAD